MTIHYATRGFVFKKEDRLDADRLFSVFTEDFGRLEISGRAIRKIDSKLKAGIELFSLADIEFIQGKNKKTLTDAVAVKAFGDSTRNPEKFELAKSIAQVVVDLIHGPEKDARILQLLVETFSLLESVAARQLLYHYFFWNFVSLLGYAPSLAELQPDVATVVRMILARDWQQLQVIPISKETQQLLKQISRQYKTSLVQSA